MGNSEDYNAKPFSFQIDTSANEISFLNIPQRQSMDNQKDKKILTMSTQISIGYLSVFADFKSTGISRFVSECSTFLSFGIDYRSKRHFHKKHGIKNRIASPLSTSLDADRQSIFSEESFLTSSYASTSRPPSEFQWGQAVNSS